MKIRLSAIFQTWHVWDGSRPLRKGQLVKLSFEVRPVNLKWAAGADSSDRFEDLGFGWCRFSGELVEVANRKDVYVTLNVQGGGFRFHINFVEATLSARGARVAGEGFLLLAPDYALVQDPPGRHDRDVLTGTDYILEVRRIRKVAIPDHFISRGQSGWSAPNYLKPGDYSASDVEELETMEGQLFNQEFYVIDFDGEGSAGEIISRWPPNVACQYRRP